MASFGNSFYDSRQLGPRRLEIAPAKAPLGFELAWLYRVAYAPATAGRQGGRVVNSLKTMMVVAVMGVVAYGVYATLTKAPPAPGSEDDSLGPSVEIPGEA